MSTSDNYCIKPEYISRVDVKYDTHVEESAKVWQPYVYELGVALARERGCSTILDVGCGAARKLASYMDEFSVIGVDYGDNIEYCREEYSNATWIAQDLETDLSLTIPEDTVIICSDVIEHLLDPDPLMHSLTRLLSQGSVLVLSTPNRKPASNRTAQPEHVREWTLDELKDYVSLSVPISWSGVTQSNSGPKSAWSTSLLVCTNQIEDIVVPEEWGR